MALLTLSPRATETFALPTVLPPLHIPPPSPRCCHPRPLAVVTMRSKLILWPPGLVARESLACLLTRGGGGGLTLTGAVSRKVESWWGGGWGEKRCCG